MPMFYFRKRPNTLTGMRCCLPMLADPLIPAFPRDMQIIFKMTTEIVLTRCDYRDSMC